MNPDIKFSPGSNYVLVIDTDAYSGNFERELAAYAAGAFFEDEDGGRGEEEFEKFMKASKTNPVLSGLREKVISRTHAEYGEVFATIWTTPGRINNGMGVNSDGDEGYPAYESVAIFLEAPLTVEELLEVKTRAVEFSEIGTRWLDSFKVLRIRMLDVRFETRVLQLTNFPAA